MTQQHAEGTRGFTVVPLQRTGDSGPTQHAPPEVETVSAVERYKEIIAMASESVARMRANDESRVADLVAKLSESQDRIAEIIERERVVKLGVQLHWESAVEALWDERWLTMSPVPPAEETVPPRDQREYNTAMDLAYQVLEDSLQKRSLLRRKTKE